MDIIAGGKTVKHRLTIPEGLTSAEILALVRAAPALDGDPGPPPAEGGLMPDTYLYEYGDSRKEMIERMQRAMAPRVGRGVGGAPLRLAVDRPRELLVLASLVEKEAAARTSGPASRRCSSTGCASACRCNPIRR